jgi:uncharacterized repeat protein (TIGR02543 family)
MKNLAKLLGIITIMVIIGFTLASCGGTSSPQDGTYTVTFNSNGGNGSVSSQIVSAGSSITLPGGSNLSRSGYTFGGWNTNSSGTGTNYNAGSSYAPSGNITLYAKWDGSGPNNGGGGADTGLYMGIIGFYQEMTQRPISLLNGNTMNQFYSYIDGLNNEDKIGTLLYWSVENAINMLGAATLPNDLVKVAIVTFTDGLDQGSTMLNSTYQQREPYRNFLNNEINTKRIKNLPIDAYTIGIKGNDVTGAASENEFKINIASLASPGNDNLVESGGMDEVNQKFKDIAEDLYKENTVQTIRLNFPGSENGATYRFTFDIPVPPPQQAPEKNGSTSTLYIEGTIDYNTKSLKNVTYGGMSSSSVGTVTGTSEGILFTMLFNDIKNQVNTDIPVPTNNVLQWEKQSNGDWTNNSEFRPADNQEVIVTRKSAVIMLCLDISTSLGSDISKVKSSAKEFINVLVNGSNSGNPPNNPTTYTVTFNANGGSGSISSMSANAGSSITLPYGSSLSRSGYTFSGWNTNSSGTGTNYSAGSSYTVNGNVTLYAKWNSSGPSEWVLYENGNFAGDDYYVYYDDDDNFAIWFYYPLNVSAYNKVVITVADTSYIEWWAEGVAHSSNGRGDADWFTDIQVGDSTRLEMSIATCNDLEEILLTGGGPSGALEDGIIKIHLE